MWFRGLPKPLIPESAINYMVQVKKAEPNQKIKMLHELYNELIVPGESSSLRHRYVTTQKFHWFSAATK